MAKLSKESQRRIEKLWKRVEPYCNKIFYRWAYEETEDSIPLMSGDKIHVNIVDKKRATTNKTCDKGK